MNRERKADPAPEAPASDEATEPWWKQHPSSATVLLIAGATSALYFFGSKRLDKLATEFGLAGPPRSMGLQEVMVAGVDVFQLPVLLILFAAAVLLVLVLKLVIWVHEYASKGQDALIEGVNAQQEKAAALKKRDEITDDELADLEHGLTELISRVSRNSKLRKASRYAMKFGKIFRVVLASVTLGLSWPQVSWQANLTLGSSEQRWQATAKAVPSMSPHGEASLRTPFSKLTTKSSLTERAEQS